MPGESKILTSFHFTFTFQASPYGSPAANLKLRSSLSFGFTWAPMWPGDVGQMTNRVMQACPWKCARELLDFESETETRGPNFQDGRARERPHATSRSVAFASPTGGHKPWLCCGLSHTHFCWLMPPFPSYFYSPPLSAYLLSVICLGNSVVGFFSYFFTLFSPLLRQVVVDHFPRSYDWNYHVE